MGKIRRLAGDTVLYGLGSIVPRFLNFLLVALHTRVLQRKQSTEFLPTSSRLDGFSERGICVSEWRLPISVSRPKPGADEGKIFNQAQTAVMVISIGLSILLAVFAVPMAEGIWVGESSRIFLSG